MTLPPKRSTARDIERYAGLFAARTRVMKSSAMRDMMAVTARPEVISLAGGLPDTSTFPTDTFAAVTQAIADGDSWDTLAASLNGALEAMPLDGQGKPTHEYHRQVSLMVGNRRRPAIHQPRRWRNAIDL